MRARALVVLAALVAAPAITTSATAVSAAGHAKPATAATPALQPDARRAPLSLTRADLRSPAALRAGIMRVTERRLKAASRATATAAATVPAAQLPVYGYGNTESALPDLTGDGVGEILSSRLYARHPALLVLDGSNGRVLWKAPAPDSTLMAVYVPGPAGKSVVLLTTISETDQSTPVNDAAATDFTVTAVNPRTGATLWSTSITGALESDPTGQVLAGLGEFDGVLERAGTTAYLLVDRFSFDFGPAAIASSVAPEVLDVTTGNVVSTGAPVAGDDFAFAVTTGDVDGDGTQDYVVGTGGDTPVIGTRSSATGAPIWTSTMPSPTYFDEIATSADFTGDHRDDLVLGTFGTTGSTVHLVNGAQGGDVWSTEADFGMPLGDANHDGRSETMVASIGSRLSLACVTATGHRLWSRELLMPRSGRVSFWNTDINGDGVNDVYIEIATLTAGGGDAAVSASAPTTAYIVDGRTGRMRSGHDLGTPAFADLAGHPFLLRGAAVKHRFAVTAYDGRDGRTMWHAKLPVSDGLSVPPVDVIGWRHGQQAVVALVQGFLTNTLAVLDGRSGALLWRQAYDVGGGDGFFVSAGADVVRVVR